MAKKIAGIVPTNKDVQRVAKFFRTVASVQESVDFHGLEDGKYQCFNCGDRVFPLIKGKPKSLGASTNRGGWCLNCLYSFAHPKPEEAAS